MSAESEPKVFRITFALIVFAFLLLLSLWIISPFLPAIIWSAMIVVSSWPLMLRVQSAFGGKRGLAVLTMTISLLLVFILPLSLALITVVNHASEISQFFRNILENGIPHSPDWLRSIPLLGKGLAERWDQAAMAGRGEILSRLMPYVGMGFSWFISQVGNISILFMHFLLTVILSGFLYARGENAAACSVRFAEKFAGDKGTKALILAAQSVRAVALGVVVTALLQSFLSAIGFVIAGVPYASILCSLIFFLGVIQVGAGPVLILAIIWLYSNSSTLVATAFLVWALVVMVADNLVRPLLIKAGADLPLLLIFAGVIGGLIAFGVIGLFIGPVVLAVTYTLLKAWLDN